MQTRVLGLINIAHPAGAQLLDYLIVRNLPTDHLTSLSHPGGACLSLPAGRRPAKPACLLARPQRAIYAFSRSPLRSVAFSNHAPRTKKSCHPSLHSSIIFSPYSLRPRSSGPVLLVPKVNLQPAAFAILTNAAPGSL